MPADWNLLQHEANRLSAISLRELFEADQSRCERYHCKSAGIRLDFTRQRVDDTALAAFDAVARSSDLDGAIKRLFAGEIVNTSEGRPALHMALRAPADAGFTTNSEPVMDQVYDELQRASALAEQVRSGAYRGYTGEPIDTVVNIGIGGSDLGPKLVCDALAEHADGPTVRFLSRVDPLHFRRTLRGLHPARTVFIIASKTFTTGETLTNAQSARDWLVQKLGEAAVGRHFCALSTNLKAVAEFGIDPELRFGFWDWVGGRYSVWSVIGLPIMMSLGPARFRAFLDGAAAMDSHVQAQPVAHTLPGRMAMLGVWNTNLLGATTHAILSYDERLGLLPDYLQQLEMESNGKGVDRDGRPLTQAACPVLWGGLGNSGQHAYYQLLHQGLRPHAADFILCAEDPDPKLPHHRRLMANALAQASALAFGRYADEVKTANPDCPDWIADSRACPGNRPSSLLILDRIDPHTLGALLAAYEHKVFLQSVLWGNNPFDQWGVELGKVIAKQVEPALAGEGGDGLDPAAAQGVALLRSGSREVV